MLDKVAEDDEEKDFDDGDDQDIDDEQEQREEEADSSSPQEQEDDGLDVEQLLYELEHKDFDEDHSCVFNLDEFDFE